MRWSIQPYLGRFFHDADEHGPNSAPYLVISYDYWHSQFQDDRSVVGRVVQVNKHPFTILGVAPPEFNGTLLFFYPDFWVPMVQQEQIQGLKVLNARGERDIFMVLGHLKAGVTPAQAIADLNSVGAYLEKTYPKDDAHMTLYPGASQSRRRHARAAGEGIPDGNDAAGGIDSAGRVRQPGQPVCRPRRRPFARSGSASRAGIESQTAFCAAFLPKRCSSRCWRRCRAVGQRGAAARVERVAADSPISACTCLCTPDAKVYLVALLLALASGFLFGAVPVRQILRTNPYEVVKAGSSGIIAGNTGRRLTLRDMLLVVQIAICAVLVTSSLVAVRGLVRSMHSNFGFDPQNAMLAGYNPPHGRLQRRPACRPCKGA